MSFSFPPSDRVVDDLNPVLTFTRREVDSLLHFVEEEPDPSQVQLKPHDGMESVLSKALHLYPHLITKVRTCGNGVQLLPYSSCCQQFVSHTVLN